MNTTAPAPSPEQLRDRMVQAILDAGRATDLGVERALREVPRHAFVPEAAAEDAYDPELAVITKRAATGEALSCASVPTLVATMLDQLQVRPGHRVMECGAGTGYNAALLRNLTGPSGQVTTIDIDQEVTAGASANLKATGYQDVTVVTRDGALGDREHAPYDRMIVTVGAWDIPQAWWEQMSPGARLVVPLRWRGQTRSLGLVLGEDGVLRSDSVELCGFVPMIGQDGELTAHIDGVGLVSLYWDVDQEVDLAALLGVLDLGKTVQWSGVLVGPTESFDGIWLRMTADEPVCRIAAHEPAISSGLCTPIIPVRSPALVQGGSVAYMAKRRIEGRGAELGAIGHGPDGANLAQRLCSHIDAWNLNRNAQPVVTAYNAVSSVRPSADTQPIVKGDCQLTVTF